MVVQGFAAGIDGHAIFLAEVDIVGRKRAGEIMLSAAALDILAGADTRAVVGLGAGISEGVGTIGAAMGLAPHLDFGAVLAEIGHAGGGNPPGLAGGIGIVVAHDRSRRGVIIAGAQRSGSGQGIEVHSVKLSTRGEGKNGRQGAGFEPATDV